MMLIEDWRPIAEAKQDGTPVMVYAAEKDGLPAFKCVAAYHPDAGWCVDELREATHFTPLPPDPGKEKSVIPAEVTRTIDELALALPVIERLLDPEHPPADTPPADGLRHYGESRRDAWWYWLYWRSGARAVAALDAWMTELMPAPTGGRARTRD